jgi:acetyl esterase
LPILQVLIYPVTDLRMQSRSHELFSEGFLLTHELMRWFRGHYLSTERECLDPRASPLLTEDLRSLPRAFVATAGFDPLRDEGRAYADRLRDSGVAVNYRCYEGLIHGFASFTGGIAAARVALGEVAASLRHAFG